MSFDPNEFLNTTVTEAFDTKATPVPVGEYNAAIDKVESRAWVKKDDPSKSGITLEVFWSLDDAGVKEALGRDKVTVKQGIMLDLTDEGKVDVAKGRNIGLGRLREALDLNVPGQPFAFSMLPGRVAKVSVSHRLGDVKPGETEAPIYPEIKAVTRL